MKRWSAIVLALSLALPLAARAKVPEFNPNAFSLHGAETLGMGGLGVEIGYGVPNLELSIGVGLFDMEGIAEVIAPAIDLTARLKTAYLLQTEVGGKLRFRVIKVKSEGARHALALWGDFGYVLKNTVSPTDDHNGEYMEYRVDDQGGLVPGGDGNPIMDTQKFAYEDKKQFGWPYGYRDTKRVGFGLLYSVRGGGKTVYLEAGADYWIVPDREILGEFVPADGLGGQAWQPGYWLEREPFWTTRLTAGIEFNLSINVNFFLAASVMIGEDPNLGGDGLQQKLSGGTPVNRVVGTEWDPFEGREIELTIPVVESPDSEVRFTGQFMAGILLFFNEF